MDRWAGAGWKVTVLITRARERQTDRLPMPMPMPMPTPRYMIHGTLKGPRHHAALMHNSQGGRQADWEGNGVHMCAFADDVDYKELRENDAGGMVFPAQGWGIVNREMGYAR